MHHFPSKRHFYSYLEKAATKNEELNEDEDKTPASSFTTAAGTIDFFNNELIYFRPKSVGEIFDVNC